MPAIVPRFAELATRPPPGRDTVWDETVAAFPGVTFFHGTPWLNVLRDAYGFQPVLLQIASVDSVRPAAALPIIEADSWLIGRRGIALPFSDLCPPLCADQHAFDRLRREVESIGGRRGWKYWEIRGADSFLPAESAATTYFVHELDLRKGADAVWNSIADSHRRAVRKAEQNGVRVNAENKPESMREYYRLHQLTRRRHGQPPQPYAFFQSLFRHVIERGLGMIFTAYAEDRPIAANIYVYHGRNAVYKFGASDPAFSHLRASNYLMWRAIHSLLTDDFESLHFGRTSIHQKGLRRFKLGWGAVEKTCHYFRFNMRRRTFVRVADQAAGPHSVVFRRLPLSWSRLLGKILYRHMA